MASKKAKETKPYRYDPDYAVSPGQALQETVDALGIDQKELAKRADLSVNNSTRSSRASRQSLMTPRFAWNE